MKTVKQKEATEYSKRLKEKELSECSFHPQTHFSKEYKAKKYNNDIEQAFFTRSQKWNNIKIKKIKKLYLDNLEKERKDLKFTPVIHTINYGDNKEASRIVLDPESYCMYINQKKDFFNKNLEKKRREDSSPGSGLIWRNKPTITVEFNLETEKRKVSKKKCRSISYTPYILVKQINPTKSRNSCTKSSIDSAMTQLHEELLKLSI